MHALTAKSGSTPRVIATIGAAWFLSLGFDFFLHAGLLARLYVQPSPFLLDPLEALRRIPAGYAGFLGLVIAQHWLFRATEINDARMGWRVGALGGAVVWGALVLGLYSISSADPALLVSWWIGQSGELALSGAALGASHAGMSMRRLWSRVVAAVLVLVMVTVLLQGMGWSPAVRIH